VRWAGPRGTARLIGWAFVVLTLGSLIWIAIAYISREYALMAQNIVLTLIKILWDLPLADLDRQDLAAKGNPAFIRRSGGFGCLVGGRFW